MIVKDTSSYWLNVAIWHFLWHLMKESWFIELLKSKSDEGHVTKDEEEIRL